MSHIGKSHSEEVPCRSCTSFAEYIKQSKKRYVTDLTKSGSDSNNNKEPNIMRDDCPADKTVLGKATWTLLHSMAAKYPVTPSVEDKKDIIAFFNIFAKFYPCDYCAKDFRQEIKTNPPVVSSQEELSQWLCRMHNIVNIKIGKPVFDCKKVNERWRDGWLDGSCG